LSPALAVKQVPVGVKGAPFVPDAQRENLSQFLSEFLSFLARDKPDQALGFDPGPEERFRGIDIPDSRQDRLIDEGRVNFRAPHAKDFQIRRLKSVGSQMSPENIKFGWIHQADFAKAAGIQKIKDAFVPLKMQTGPGSGFGRSQNQLSRHPEADDQSVFRIQGEQKKFSQTFNTLNLFSNQVPESSRGRMDGGGSVPRDDGGVQNLDGGDAPAFEVGLQFFPEGFHFGKFRHGWASFSRNIPS
jgi:hypothetical protein